MDRHIVENYQTHYPGKNWGGSTINKSAPQGASQRVELE
jgi:hypothetical protein